MSTLIEAPIEIPKVEKADESIVFVTGLWDIGRDALKEGWSRGYQHYLNRFEELLKTPYNLIVYGDDSLETYVFQRRSIINTQFIKRDTSFFVNTEFHEDIQKIRNDPEWSDQAGWLKDSTQAKLELYNPLVTSKMFLLNDAKLLSKFKSEYMFWIDAGLSNTVHWGYFNETGTINRLKKYFNKFSFICFPYDASNEIHGFKFPDICRIAGDTVKLVGRGGFFGGPTESISPVNSLYYGLLKSTLSEGLMGTEESIFSILVYKHADLINYFEIEDNGLISAFFENLKNDALKIKNKLPEAQINCSLSTDNVGLYVITYNSPNQFRTLIKSMNLYDKNFVTKPKKFLLDNSKDEKTFDEYAALCQEHDFVHIKKDNLGICGGRQFIAEHSDEQGFDFHFFFEDDMFFYSGDNTVCRNGFVRKIPDLYNKSIDIARLHNLDFLKLSFSEFFGDNSIQWSWYNVPQKVRERVWPNKCTLPETGQDPNAPKTRFESILSYKNLAFATGDVYYSNWPQVVTKHGNKKMFLTTKWAHPYEQTWMSYIFQQKLEGEINGGLLLATPTEHDRFEHYDRSERREN